jgi:oligoribonuclease NrnB/cAMP/cGMP phosphodiesterase (DHH superfamily)
MAFGEEKFQYSCVGIARIDQVIAEFLEANKDKGIDLYITDISVNEEVARMLQKRVQKGQKVVLIDHHASALALGEKYKWAHVQPAYEDGTKTAATTLFYDYLIEQGYLKKTAILDEYVELVRQFDTWDWFANENEKAKQLNHLFYLISRHEFEEAVLPVLQSEEGSFAFSERHETLLEAEEKKIEKYIREKQKQMMKAVLSIGGKEWKAGIVFAENYQSELGNALCLEDEEIDFSAMVDMGRKKIGFRTTKDELSLIDVVSPLGGGGHPKAAGCSLTKETFDLFVQSQLFQGE